MFSLSDYNESISHDFSAHPTIPPALSDEFGNAILSFI
jgi:hypothetical protein